MSPLRRTIFNLAFSSNFPKLPIFDPKILQIAGIGRVAFIRHGNTAPSPDGNDFQRQLTGLGREQANIAGSAYGIKLQPYHPIVLCSPAPRCKETADIFLNASNTGTIDFLYERGLYDGTMQPEGSKLFQKIGYAPLRSYYEDPDLHDRATAHDVLGSYAATALDAIQRAANLSLVEVVDQQQQQEDCTTLLLFAHAVYLPAAALGLASSVGCVANNLDRILDTNTKEAEGYLVDIDETKTTLLCRPADR